VPTGDVWEDARSELRWAMAGTGLTADKLATMPAVLSLPAVRAAVAGEAAQRRLVVACETVADAARRLGDGVHARILRTSLAIDYAGSAKDLTSRRDEFIRVHNDAVRAAGRTDYLGETARSVFEVENKMLNVLLTLLGASPPSVAPVAPGDIGPVPATATSGYGYAHQEITYRLSGRASREAEAVYVIRALDDGVDACDLAYYCSREGGRPSRFVLLEGGGVLRDHEVGRQNFRVATVGFAPLAKGGERRVRFDVVYPGSGDAEPWLVVHVVRPTERLVTRLTFDVAEVPSRVWRIDGVHPEARAGDPATSAPLAVDEYGCVEAAWDHPPLSLTYGIAWEW
jgi:hypothetical protein